MPESQIQTAESESVIDRAAALEAIQSLRHACACDFSADNKGAVMEARCNAYYNAYEAVQKMPGAPSPAPRAPAVPGLGDLRALSEAADAAKQASEDYAENNPGSTSEGFMLRMRVCDTRNTFRDAAVNYVRTLLDAAPAAPAVEGGEKITKSGRCPNCRGNTFDRVDERKPDGSFGPGLKVRCVECKKVYDDPMTISPATAGEGDLRGALGDNVVSYIRELCDLFEGREADETVLVLRGASVLAGDLRRAVTALARPQAQAEATEKPLAPGCCSAISPCAHQRTDPTTICGTCDGAAAIEARALGNAAEAVLAERERERIEVACEARCRSVGATEWVRIVRDAPEVAEKHRSDMRAALLAADAIASRPTETGGARGPSQAAIGASSGRRGP